MGKTLITKGLGLNGLGLRQVRQKQQGKRYSPHCAFRASSWA